MTAAAVLAPVTDAVETGAAAPARLAVRRLVLTDFRCYASLRLEIDPRPVVLTGPNGAGKTNLLEAVSFLVPGRGLRRARLSDIVRRDTDAAPRVWAVAATLATADGPVEIGTGLDPAAPAEGGEDGGGRRIVRIDGSASRGQAALGALASAVWLTPEMDRLFVEGRSARRRFVDRLVYGFDRAHAARVAAYEQAMRERTRLLREAGARAKAADAAWLDALESQMAEQGVAIAAARRHLVARLAAAAALRTGPFPAAGLALAGEIEDRLAEAPALAVEDDFRRRLALFRATDAEAGAATTGPHRTDLRVRHLAKDAPAAACSTGEQKALLVAITLAHARLQAVEAGQAPLLLLDEIAAHLDAARRAALYDELAGLGAQAWMTGTDLSDFAPWGARAQFVAVEAARAQRIASP